MDQTEQYMQRCLDLARLGGSKVSPNPLVGAVLVYKDRIIGEGFHQAYGSAHAEVNAVKSVQEKDRHLLKDATFFVSLEPCCVFGKTPPCTDLIIQNRIKKVVVSALDRSAGVNGAGINILRSAGIEVQIGILQQQGEELAAIRNTFVTKQRPYVILKYAQTSNGFFAKQNGQPFWISNAFSKRLVHKWRSEVDSILVTSRTAQLDNPRLSNRLYFGSSPIRIILDRRLTLTGQFHVLDGSYPTLIVHEPSSGSISSNENVQYLTHQFSTGLAPFLQKIHDLKISSLLVEGGAQLLQSFINEGMWDEARVFTGSPFLPQGIPSPNLPYSPQRKIQLGTDSLSIYKNKWITTISNFPHNFNNR